MQSSEVEPNAEAQKALDHGADSSLQRRLVTLHVVMVALGTSIGMGLWLGSGKCLATGGPASLFLGYFLASTIVWALSQSIGEMAVIYPIPSAFVQWTNHFVDPALGFTLGWSYWMLYATGLVNGVQGLVTVLSYWIDSVPVIAVLVMMFVLSLLVNLAPVTLFGNLEIFFSSIKFLWIFIVIITSVVITSGAAPVGDSIGFRYWTTYGFINGFKGFLSVLPTTIFTFAGSESAALTVSELRNPRKAVPKAVRSIWVRLAVFYILGSIAVTITVDPVSEGLFGNEGSGASPFVIAFQNAGLPGLSHSMNFIILISVVSCSLIGSFGGARTAVGLAQIGMAPKICQKADSKGRPWPSIALIMIVGGSLTFLNLNHSGLEVFGWFSNIAALFTLFGWGMISFSHIRFRRAWATQGRTVEELPWASSTYPFCAYWALFWCIAIIAVQFYLSVWPLHEKSSAKTFFVNFVSIIFVIVLYTGAKLWFRGSFLVDLKTVDLDKERRFYASTSDETGQNSGEKPKSRLLEACLQSYRIACGAVKS
ncbi:amino acid transporter [Microthyrium microscopicum]|uniref:Amino acid transporter n=1 Tax=Microthyrium microscopicum TaxID=703497 RepID=A0A6A6U9F6_9PEZI|nr:amino acid transporter [Microthyrium microscopicum]